MLKDASTGEVLAEAAESIGRASNNVAEYRGLIAGLQLYAEHTPGAALEVRMDSKLVIEQMAGRWKVKHPNMRPLAISARRLAPADATWTWVPRVENAAADRLANLAMDAAARGSTYVVDPPTLAVPGEVAGADANARTDPKNPMLGWTDLGAETTVVWVRHGETDNTLARVFCGPGGADPGLNPTGRTQAASAAVALASTGDIDVLLSSPMRRTRETANAVAEATGLSVRVAEAFRECSFGQWDGLTLAEVEERSPDELDRWLSSHDVRPPGGESMADVQARVEKELTGILTTYAGKTVAVVSHVNPIKLAVRKCLDAPLAVMHRMLVAPASITTMTFYESGGSVLRQFSATP